MTNEVRPIPERDLPVILYLCCKDVAAAIDFYKTAFGATELESMRIAAQMGNRTYRDQDQQGAYPNYRRILRI